MIEALFCRGGGDVDDLEEGYWLIQRRRSRRVDIPVRIWFGPPDDPDTGEEMDRSWRWRILIAGAEFTGEDLRIGGIPFDDLTTFWPGCRRDPIDAAEYEFRLERQAWAAAYDPNDPYGRPGGKIDAMTATLPFMEN